MPHVQKTLFASLFLLVIIVLFIAAYKEPNSTAILEKIRWYNPFVSILLRIDVTQYRWNTVFALKTMQIV